MDLAEHSGKGREMSDRRKREEKLIKQWKEHGYLTPESMEQQENSENVAPDKDRIKRRLRVLYILLGFGIIILVVGLVLLFIQYY